MKNVKKMYELYAANKHPFSEVILSLLNNTNNSTYAVDNLKALLQVVESDVQTPVILKPLNTKE